MEGGIVVGVSGRFHSSMLLFFFRPCAQLSVCCLSSTKVCLLTSSLKRYSDVLFSTRGFSFWRDRWWCLFFYLCDELVLTICHWFPPLNFRLNGILFHTLTDAIMTIRLLLTALPNPVVAFLTHETAADVHDSLDITYQWVHYLFVLS